MKYSKYFSLKMNTAKSSFPFWKTEFEILWILEPIGNSMHTTEYLAFGKALLGRLYTYKKSHALNEVLLFGFLHFWGFLWSWELTFIENLVNFNSPILFPMFSY